jgi:chemotaxis protein MotB
VAAERRRRNQDGKKENHERWVISYADFMTLLLATFVVLYAVSSINVSRYRAAADALSAVFTGRAIVPDKGAGTASNGVLPNQPSPVPKPVVRLATPQKGVPNVSEKIRERIARLDQAYKNLSHLLQDVIGKGQVHIERNGLSVVIDINASVLFDSGKAALTTQALGVIDQIGTTLKDQSYSIQVNGFTDNAPIHTPQFDSNWELSASRAISVVRRFVSDGVDPSHLVGAGYGEYHPIASNDAPDGMARNRRVSIVVNSADDGVSASDATGAAGTTDSSAAPPASAPPAAATPAAAVPDKNAGPALPPPRPVGGDAASLIDKPALPSLAPVEPVSNQATRPLAPDQSH